MAERPIGFDVDADASSPDFTVQFTPAVEEPSSPTEPTRAASEDGGGKTDASDEIKPLVKPKESPRSSPGPSDEERVCKLHAMSAV